MTIISFHIIVLHFHTVLSRQMNIVGYWVLINNNKLQILSVDINIENLLDSEVSRGF